MFPWVIHVKNCTFIWQISFYVSLYIASFAVARYLSIRPFCCCVVILAAQQKKAPKGKWTNSLCVPTRNVCQRNNHLHQSCRSCLQKNNATNLQKRYIRIDLKETIYRWELQIPTAEKWHKFAENIIARALRLQKDIWLWSFCISRLQKDAINLQKVDIRYQKMPSHCRAVADFDCKKMTSACRIVADFNCRLVANRIAEKNLSLTCRNVVNICNRQKIVQTHWKIYSFLHANCRYDKAVPILQSDYISAIKNCNSCKWSFRKAFPGKRQKVRPMNLFSKSGHFLNLFKFDCTF